MSPLPATRKYQEIPFDIHKFTGLNIREDSAVISDSELIDCQNYDLGRAGELNKRTGFVTKHAGATLGATQTKILGFFQTDVYAQFIALAGSSLYTSSDAVTWTVMPGGPHGAVEYGIQYGNKFYMVRNNSTILKWDGAAVAAIAGSPKGTYCYSFKNRLFVINTLAVGSLSSRLTYSEDTTFPGGTGVDFALWPATYFIDIQVGDGDFLIGLVNLHNVLIVFKTSSIWTLHVQGAPITWVVRSLSNSIGCIAKNSFQLFEGVLIFYAINGVYETDGNVTKCLSNSIFPAFSGVTVSSNTVNKACAFIWQDKYILMVESFLSPPTWGSFSTFTWNAEAAQPWGNINASYSYYVYHFRPKGWTKWTPITVKPQIFVPVLSSSALRGVYCSDRDNLGHIYKYGDSVYQDDANSYDCIVETKDTDFGSPIRMKRSKWMAIKQRGVGTHTVTQIADGISKPSTSIVATDSVKIEFKIIGAGYLRQMRIRAVTTTVGPMTLFGFTTRLNIMFSRSYTETGI